VNSPAWHIDPDAYFSQVAIIVLDYQTLELKRAYLSQHGHCDRSSVSPGDHELQQRAGALFYATQFDWRESLAIPDTFQRIGDFVVQELEPTDFGGVAISHPCSGLVIYGATIVWSGMGQQIYPAMALPAHALRTVNEKIAVPRRSDVLIGPYADDALKNSKMAWATAQNLNLVQEMATSPYSVLLYLYPPTVGMFDVSKAEWVIFVHRGEEQNQYYENMPPTQVSPLAPSKPYGG